MRILAAGLLMFTLVGFASADSKKGPPPPAKGKTHTSDAGRFRVLAIGELKSESKNLSTAAGVLEVRTERFEGVRDLMVAVVYTDYPETFKDADVKSVLEGVCEGMRGVDGKLVRNREDSLGTGADTITGRDVRIEAGRNVVHARIFLNGSRLYQVMASGPRDAVDGKIATDFVNSFELVK